MASTSVIFVYTTTLILIISRCVNCINYCQEHQFIGSENSSQMQFTKEAVNQDYAVNGEFKSLHCCAKGYRSIEW